MKNLIPLHTGAASLVAVAIMIGGCTQTTAIPTKSGATQVSSKTPTAFVQFPDVPVPPGSKINVDRTLVFGSKPWFGQLTLTSTTSSNRAFDFFRAMMPGQGWQEVTSVRAPTSILTYDQDDRVLAIAIQAATLLGSEITITMSPKGTPSSNFQGGNLPPPVTRQ